MGRDAFLYPRSLQALPSLVLDTSAVLNFPLAKGKVTKLCTRGNWWKILRWKNPKPCLIWWMKRWSVPELGTSSIFDHQNLRATVNEANEKLNVTCTKMIRIQLRSSKETASEMNSLNVPRKPGNAAIHYTDICLGLMGWIPWCPGLTDHWMHS